MKEVGFVLTVSSAIVIVTGLIVFLAVDAFAQETTSTATSTPTEGVDVSPDGTQMTTTTPSTTLPSAPAVYLPSFDERIQEITNPDVRQLVELKADSDLLASKYAKLYDSCRFSR